MSVSNILSKLIRETSIEAPSDSSSDTRRNSNSANNTPEVLPQGLQEDNSPNN
ncbi:MAG: hypothetical protein ACQESK_09015 [Bacteroidota bacterium]